MHSAFRLTDVAFNSDPASCLFAALNELLRSVDGRVVLLRPLTECFHGQREDIDLLLTESQREQILRAAFTHCTQGRMHCRIQQNSPAKAQLILWTLDCTQKLMIDLWISFDQLPRHRYSCIPADRLLPALNASSPDAETQTTEKIPALRQLPPDIDLCLLIQHLATKRRDVTTTVVRQRIARACKRLKSWSPEQASQHHALSALRTVADQLPNAIMITSRFVALSEDYLLQRLINVQGNRGLPVLETRRRRGRITELRRIVLKHRPTVAVVGSDGAGKSSVVSALTQLHPKATPVVAKKLYRRSLTYQIISALMQQLRGTDRGTFDDRTALPVTLRATVAFWIKIVFSELPCTRVLDRSIASFLITNRKSDTPHLSRGATWIEALIPPVTSVLLTLPHLELTRRKQEMSAPGHNTYQRMLFEQALRQQPTDLILLANVPSAQAAATAVCELLWNEERSVESSTETAGNRKAAA